MQVSISDIKKLMLDTLTSRGVSKLEAGILAEHYLEGELEGKYSHGLTAFPSMVRKLGRKLEPIKIVKKTHALIFADANFNKGILVGRRLADEAIKMSRKEGVGIALIKNMTTWLRPGTVAKYIADKGYITLVTNNGGSPMVSPEGGRDPILGTNPIGIGIPTDQDAIVADMATSVRAWGEVRLAKKFGYQLPVNAFLDKHGNFTRDPNKAHSAYPFGGYKGFTLGLLIEILSGSLLGMPMGEYSSKDSYEALPRGAMILVINPRMTTNLNTFKKANTRLVKTIKKSKRKKGVKVLMMPGERAATIKKKNLKQGSLNINPKLWDELRGLSA